MAETYGTIANIPSGNGFNIAKQFARNWVDDNGIKFNVQLHAAYDAMAGVNAIGNQQIIDALDDGQPLIVGARSHAMVMTKMVYLQGPVGPVPQAVGVFDPWPGIGPRSLATDEMIPRQRGGNLWFIALPTVTDA